MLLCQCRNLIVVDLARFIVEAILYGVVDLAGKIRFGTMGQMTAGIQAHAEDGIPRLDQRHVHRRVGL